MHALEARYISCLWTKNNMKMEASHGHFKWKLVVLRVFFLLYE